MAEVCNIIIFKDITTGFMNIDEILDLQKRIKEKKLENKVCFGLMNNASPEKNQAIMQMFNGLIGFDIFKYAIFNDKIIKYEFLQDNRLKKDNINVRDLQLEDLKSFIKEDVKHNKLKFTFIENEIFNNLKKII